MVPQRSALAFPSVDESLRLLSRHLHIQKEKHQQRLPDQYKRLVFVCLKRKFFMFERNRNLILFLMMALVKKFT